MCCGGMIFVAGDESSAGIEIPTCEGVTGGGGQLGGGGEGMR